MLNAFSNASNCSQICNYSHWQNPRKPLIIHENPAVSTTAGFFKKWSRVRESNPA
nr:MAG TPA: hypothetical protein [Caudoviricetes sp.]